MRAFSVKIFYSQADTLKTLYNFGNMARKFLPGVRKTPQATGEHMHSPFLRGFYYFFPFRGLHKIF